MDSKHPEPLDGAEKQALHNALQRHIQMATEELKEAEASYTQWLAIDRGVADAIRENIIALTSRLSDLAMEQAAIYSL
jgi:hypothetical protein